MNRHSIARDGVNTVRDFPWWGIERYRSSERHFSALNLCTCQLERPELGVSVEGRHFESSNICILTVGDGGGEWHNIRKRVIIMIKSRQSKAHQMLIIRYVYHPCFKLQCNGSSIDEFIVFV